MEIITNISNLKEDEMTDFTTKVKLLLINSKDEILLVNSYNEYQFPGGTREINEELIDTVKRELLEETGIELDFNSLEPFIKSSGYYKDWPEVGRNKKVEIYYYEINTDEVPNMNRINLTEKEKNGNFILKYVSLENVEDILKENMEQFGDKHGIAKEMLHLLRIYKDIRKI